MFIRKTSLIILGLLIVLLAGAGAFWHYHSGAAQTNPGNVTGYPINDAKVGTHPHWKFLLTSAGLTNQIIRQEFYQMVGKPPAQISMAYVTTAADPEDNQWYIQNEIDNLKNDGITNLQVIDIKDSSDNWLPALKNADVIWLAGGNTFFLAYWAKNSNFNQTIQSLLDNKVLVGESAGSILVGPDVSPAGWNVGAKDDNDVGLQDLSGLNLVDFSVFPHYDDSQAKDLLSYSPSVSYPLYAIDDNCAVEVSQGKVKIVGTGAGLLVNGSHPIPFKLSN